MRKLAMTGLLTMAAGLLLLSGMTSSHAAQGPWCHSFGGASANIENCSIQSLEMCRFENPGQWRLLLAKSALARQPAGAAAGAANRPISLALMRSI